MGYAADEIEYAVVEVGGGALEDAAEMSPLALARRIGVWNAVNDGTARILDVRR